MTATTDRTTDSRFRPEHAPSNRCGFTLMNSQTGNVIAEVMDQRPDVEVSSFPSMIRVDGGDRIEVDYDEIAEALGESDFGTEDFEEVMSTHYGRMVREDDRMIFFANPEDAAEYLGFDLVAAR